MLIFSPARTQKISIHSIHNESNNNFFLDSTLELDFRVEINLESLLFVFVFFHGKISNRLVFDRDGYN